jgi:hypothetical protein
VIQRGSVHADLGHLCLAHLLLGDTERDGKAGGREFMSLSNRSFQETAGKTPRSSSVLSSDHLRPAAIAAVLKLKPGQRFGFHAFRHELASWLVNNGTDVKTVQGLLRHSNVTTTRGPLRSHGQRVNVGCAGLADVDNENRASSRQLGIQATFYRREIMRVPCKSLMNMVCATLK